MIFMMRLHIIVLVAIAGLLASCNAVSAAAEAKVTPADLTSSDEGRRFLRSHKTVDDDNYTDDEERGKFKDAVEKAVAHAKIPGWLIMNKPPHEVNQVMKLTESYPIVRKNLFGASKTYKTLYEKTHKKYP
ncbi:unnamed protein product [Phytophthora lilii]|uniref:RxLR effector protein n=1 Tax=Phytophthora lilii TaxID=2077276 RepID=A0A9W6WSZ4_9STRA|nr:unnamed protein product [Phytophthora lilii]